jgi:hypothetical protein
MNRLRMSDGKWEQEDRVLGVSEGVTLSVLQYVRTKDALELAREALEAGFCDNSVCYSCRSWHEDGCPPDCLRERALKAIREVNPAAAAWE